MPDSGVIAGGPSWPTQTPAERAATVRLLADALDVHDEEHVGAWGKPDVERCPFC